MKDYRVGIIGCGNIFEMHAQALIKLPMVNLVAVCDNNVSRLSKASQDYQAAAYADYNKMLQHGVLDAVHICLPHHLHEAATIAAAEAGAHVLTEKPMAISVSSAERMIQVAAKNAVQLGVVFQNRYTSGAQALKEKLELGSLGKVLAGKCQVTWFRDESYYSQSDWKGTWEKEGGGVIIDQAIHTLDLINWLVGGDAVKIDATIRNRFHDTIEVEDFAEGVIQYAEGFKVSFLATNYYSFDVPVTIELHCEQGLATMTGPRLEITYFDGRPSFIVDIPAADYIENGIASKTYWGTGHIIQITEFYEALTGRTPFAVDGLEALKIQKIVSGIYQSARLNKAIQL